MYLLQGCGVSFICPKGPIMLSWIQDIIERGGVPVVKVLSVLLVGLSWGLLLRLSVVSLVVL